MTSDRRLIGAALGVALLVAACGSSSPSPSATSAASQAAVSQAPGASTGPDVSMPAISLTPGAAGDLEAMLPSSVGGTTLQKTSMDGSQIAGAGTPLDTSNMDPTLSKYGKTIADVRLAIATGGASATGLGDLAYAIQLKGVPATEWASAVDSSYTSDPTMTIGGKQVVGSSEAGYTTAFYAKDDILFMVAAPDQDAATIISQLP